MDELLLSKLRLAIVAELLGSEWVSFNGLLRATESTNGNLGAHIAKLVDAGYVLEEKKFVDKKPLTRFRLTKAGRDAFVAHVREMQALLDGAAVKTR